MNVNDIKMLAWRELKSLGGSSPEEYDTTRLIVELMKRDLHPQKRLQTAAILSGLFAYLEGYSEIEAEEVHWHCKGAEGLRVVYYVSRWETLEKGDEQILA